MATVKLRGRDQRVTQRLPSLCACCGEPATLDKQKQFAWFPNWTYLLIPIGVLPFVIAVGVTRTFMTVRVPLCGKHPRPWLALQLVGALSLVHVFVFSWVAIILSATVERMEGSGGSGGLLVLGGWLLLWVVLLVVFFMVARRTIRPKRITEEWIVLAGVSPAFASAVGSSGGPTPAEPRAGMDSGRPGATPVAAGAGTANGRERELCFLCGNPLRAEELAARVCQACRA